MKKKARIFPDLSRAKAQSDDAPPVLLNGMKVVFDQKAALYPVRVEDRDGQPKATLRKAHGQALGFTP